MDFTELYAQKKMTADQAAALVKSGDWLVRLLQNLLQK